MGLPGSGKTTLARTLARILGAVHFNADEIRKQVNKDLGFKPEDRIEQARRMGWLAEQVSRAGQYSVCDFVCPTPETRRTFITAGVSPVQVVFMDTIHAGRFEDTNRIFVRPSPQEVPVLHGVQGWQHDLQLQAALVSKSIQGNDLFNPRAATSILIGRFQPMHVAHLELVREGLKRDGQVLMLVRDTFETDEKNPFHWGQVITSIWQMLTMLPVEQQMKVAVLPIANAARILYGRDVGYLIERVDLGADLEAISATRIRANMT